MIILTANKYKDRKASFNKQVPILEDNLRIQRDFYKERLFDKRYISTLSVHS